MDRKISSQQTLVDSRIQDSDFDNTVLCVNCLSIDRNTVVMWDHYKNETDLIKQLEQRDIEIIFVPLTYSHFFNQGVTCLTLELNRETPEGLVAYQ
jgi:N-dimethylarginine dimethylaminohydrolase